MGIHKVFKGVIFGLSLFLTSLFGVLFYSGSLLPIFFVWPPLYRYLFDFMLASWLHNASAMLEHFLGMKVVISGDEIRPNEANLIMMNHRTRLDWMYFWSVLVRQSGVKTEKIILKTPLKHIPGAGWAMQVGAFLFINRKWEEDKIILNKMMDYFADLGHKTQILLFPEGTDLTERTIANSNRFAAKNNLEPYKYCLHPRTTGFTHLVSLMRANNHLDAIYDVSIAYPSRFPQNEPELMTGNVPPEVHFHIKRHPVATLPLTNEGLQQWCCDRWKEKEKTLEAFSQTGRFGDAAKPSVGPVNMLKFTMFFWLVFVLGISFLLYYSSMARWLAFAEVVFYVVMGCYYGGFELFQADYYNKFFNNKKRV